MNRIRRLVRTATVALIGAVLCSCLGNKKLAVDASDVQLEELEPGKFPHELMDQIQARHVDEQGLVDYDALDAEPGQLLRYVAYLQQYSPKSHPALFPTRNDELAYYVNAYNAFVLYGVIQNYPGIESVNDVSVGGIKLKDGQGFFYSQRFRMGGEDINLYDLENKIIRKYDDPRIHAAINCASMGCPYLPQTAFHPATLDEELDRETRRFFAQPRNASVDEASRTVTLSKILDWFGEDFTSYVAAKSGRSKEQVSVLEYVELYAPPELAAAVEKARSGGYKVVFREYGWALNKKGAAREMVS